MVNIDYFTKFDQVLTDISICLPDGYQDDLISRNYSSRKLGISIIVS